MKALNTFFVLCLIVLIMGCSTVKVDYEFDPEVNFARLKSFNWLPVPENNARYGLIIKQIQNVMSKQLEARGFKKVSANPEFLIGLHGGIQPRLNYEGWEYLNENYKEYALKRRIDVIKYTDNMLIFDLMFDTLFARLLSPCSFLAFHSNPRTPVCRQAGSTP